MSDVQKFPLRTADDLFFQRQVFVLKVRCRNRALGCKWVGELVKLEEHLKAGFAEGKCQYVCVACPNKCGVQVQLRSLGRHKTQNCVKRPFTCQYCCDKKATYEKISKEHWPQCQQYHVQCPNKCEKKAIERRFLKRHLDEHCPLQEIECEFSYAGCVVKTQRGMMQEHMDKSKDEHILALAKNDKIITEKLRILSLALAQLSPPIFIPPSPMLMDGFERKKLGNVTWCSPSFYSHVGGYKMRLVLNANGWGSGEGTHVGVGVKMMRGEFDDRLQWPFKGEVKVQLINQRDGREHVEKTVVSANGKNDILVRVVEGNVGKDGLGICRFISHSDLYKPEEGKEYLKNDTLEFKISHIHV